VVSVSAIRWTVAAGVVTAWQDPGDLGEQRPFLFAHQAHPLPATVAAGVPPEDARTDMAQRAGIIVGERAAGHHATRPSVS
jgi:hypothetical protein